MLKMELFLDTNTLNILNSNQAINVEFLSKVQETKSCIFVSPLVIEEMLDYEGNDALILEKIVKKIEWLRGLWEALTDRQFKFVVMPRELFAIEPSRMG